MQPYEVSLDGDLTFENVSEHARVLADALETHNEINVDLSACNGIDLAGAQLLISTAKTARQGSVHLRYQNAERYRRICEYAGLKAKGLVDS